jgi:DNA invertase Pin-like site-specific DNA recombinase
MGQVRDQGTSASDTEGVATSAGILVRVSSDGQDEQNQLPEIESYCYEQNYRINKRYDLHDKSGYHGAHEPALQEVLDDIRAGFIQVVVIVHSSRIDRRDPDKAEFYHLSIRQAGGRIESVREPMFGKSDISGRVITMLAQDANYSYSKTLSGHVRASHDRIRTNRANGRGLLGRAPFGYEIRGEKYSKILVPTALGLKYVPEMYARVIGGESLATVAAWLNDEGVPTGTRIATGWHAKTVQQIIRNTVYKGQMRDSSHDFAGTCEAIVSASVFNRAGERLDAWPKRGPQSGANRAMLSSVLFCECGSPMYRLKGGATYPYYRCAGKVTGRSCFMIRLSTVDDAVDEIMSSNPDPVMKMTPVPGKNYDNELDLVRARIKALDPVDDPEYGEKHAALIAEMTGLKNLDTIPDTWEPRPTGQTWGGLWDDLGTADRSKWLASHSFRVEASREAVTISQGDRSATIRLG